MRIMTVVGARPQFIKAATISRVIKKSHQSEIKEIIVHTGQHYDENMSSVFFNQLEIPKPEYNLEISGESHGAMTGKMLEGIETVIKKEKPNYLLVYGDTNSTLAGALAAAKLQVPIAHVESGLRSYNMKMPEEINRILTDRVSKLLFCPTDEAVRNLSQEGIINGVFNVGDVMYDAAIFYRNRVDKKSNILAKLNLNSGEYVLATCHRAENTDDPSRLMSILKALYEISDRISVVFPLHPRTKKLVQKYGLTHLTKNLTIMEPLDYIDMISLEKSAKVILTDSGGVQKEAFFFNVPCITMRDETEWVETIEMGWNRVVGASKSAIVNAYEFFLSSPPKNENKKPYGSGDAAEKIVNYILKNFKDT
jgi:UDP-GlcNAc3NAcA epimerase